MIGLSPGDFERRVKAVALGFVFASRSAPEFNRLFAYSTPLIELHLGLLHNPTKWASGTLLVRSILNRESEVSAKGLLAPPAVYFKNYMQLPTEVKQNVIV